jgi:hypothetical protein
VDNKGAKNMEKLKIIRRLLKSIHAQQEGWEADFKAFIDLYRCTDFGGMSPEVQQFIELLNMELRFYVPNPDWRKESPSYYGEDKLVEIVTEALKKLEQLGIGD